MTTQLSEIEIAQWRDKKRYLWLMGLIAPTALFVDAAAGVGVQPVGLARRGAGAVLDRADPAVRRAARTGPAVTGPTARTRPTR